MNLKNLKNIKGGLSRDEMKTILGGATCSADCGASCSGDSCETISGGVKCHIKGRTIIGLCEIVVVAPPPQ